MSAKAETTGGMMWPEQEAAEAWWEKHRQELKTAVTRTRIESNRERDMLRNQVELLKEDLECVHMWLDDQGVPRVSEHESVYSIVGRVQQMLRRITAPAPTEAP